MGFQFVNFPNTFAPSTYRVCYKEDSIPILRELIFAGTKSDLALNRKIKFLQNLKKKKYFTVMLFTAKNSFQIRKKFAHCKNKFMQKK